MVSVLKEIKITVSIKESDDKNKHENPKAPKTGDTYDIWFWLYLMIAGLGTIGIAMLYGKKHSKE